MPEGRCMKCKEQVEIKDPKKTKSAKGKEYIRGSITVYIACGVAVRNCTIAIPSY